MNEMTHRPSIDSPQLRTLLLTDLCDSTALVESIGDVATATLFRDHDRLVLDLQQRWRGRLIDRSDGLLLMFERPIDGLGFALDYVRTLEVMSASLGMELKARAGLHVGEVLTWRNTDEAVLAGAKPLEVEGLAKPTAARLMSMARPGQILLSSVAEPLAHRAARELGERGQQLLWKSHGRWRFKGMPESQQVYEVGEPGIAPLRTPQNTTKAWRDIPLWRRPASLVAEAALVALFGIGVWFMTRPAPAIAFNQRDWVVVADLRNLTGQSVLDDSLEQAFRISLEQSRYVNVFSDLKARDTLTRMRREPGTVLDRAVASEIALRDGARAVILPTVAEVGGRVRVSAEIIDPHTQATVYAVSFDGTGAASALDSIDSVTGELRGNLGESIKSIERDSASLPEVTTTNLDALRAFALAQKAASKFQYSEALQLYRRATELDPQFALAWLGQVRIYYGQEKASAAVEPLRRARALKAHLPPREALYLDAWVSEFADPSTTTGKWMQLAHLYPDYLPGRGNAAIWLYTENRFEEALAHALAAAVPQNPLAGNEFDTVGRAYLGMQQYAQAQSAFEKSYSATGGSVRRLLATAAAQGDFAAAHKYVEKLEPDNPFAYLERASLAVDQGQWKQAQALARTGLSLTEAERGLESRYLLLPVAVTTWLAGDKGNALRYARSAAEQALAALAKQKASDLDADAEEDAALSLGAAIVAQRLGDRDIAATVLQELPKYGLLMKTPQLAELLVVVRAQKARLDGNTDEAVKLLLPLLTGRERFQTRAALMDAYLDAGQSDLAMEQAQWLRQHRGLAYVELECGHCLQALNVADSNRAARKESELRGRVKPAGG
ncbi:putative peptide modification system cyclase [Lysobacter arenosi]|uniref:Peptide modification system cyclase n=1 Tax=Lysobacter arenosi TaxID=2795387 RepID=A0ABX7R8Y0_9GAMM|nr:putative peptide modification system cyclase [Lysobacter arenosi]QSX74430.1 putative peptide modification system cyclase [Lysobacter arenosi]